MILVKVSGVSFLEKKRSKRLSGWTKMFWIFFQNMSEETGIPYQTLINMSLRKFAVEETELIIKVPKKRKKNQSA